MSEPGWWGTLLLASLRSADVLIKKNVDDPSGFWLRGQQLLAYSDVLRLRYPDNPKRAQDCLAAAIRALKSAEKRAAQKGGVPLLEIRCQLARAELAGALLHQDANRWRKAVETLQQLTEDALMLQSDQRLGIIPVLALCYLLQGRAYGGELLGYPVPASLELARERLDLVIATIGEHGSSRGDEYDIVTATYATRSMLEEQAGNLALQQGYAELTVHAAMVMNRPDEMSLTLTLQRGGRMAVERALVAGYKDVPDNIYEGL